MDDDLSVCLVTHPISSASEPAISGLLEVISSVATTSLITANLPASSGIRDKYEVKEVSRSGTGDSISRAAIRFISNQVRMSREIYRREEEIILFFGAISYLLPILVARLIGKKVILEPRGNVPESMYKIWKERYSPIVAYIATRPIWVLERIGYRLAHRIITLSPHMTDDLELRRFEEKLSENGTRPVNIERFHPSTTMNSRPPKVGYLGRLDEEKGVDMLIEVVKELSEDITFVFIGDGALRNKIESELEMKIDRGVVEITGWVDHEDVPEYLNQLRLLVMTSRTEGVPTTALEAMACGTPVCATPVGGIPDIVGHGETGFLIDQKQSPKEIAERLNSILEEKDLSRMSQRSRSFVVQNYRFDAVVEEYRRAFEEVTSPES